MFHWLFVYHNNIGFFFYLLHAWDLSPVCDSFPISFILLQHLHVTIFLKRIKEFPKYICSEVTQKKKNSLSLTYLMIRWPNHNQKIYRRSMCMCVWEVIGDKLENGSSKTEWKQACSIWKKVLEKRQAKYPSKPIHEGLISLCALMHFKELSSLCVNDKMW